ncbi:damage-inducible protein CinA [Aquaspirillum sp. LM1]|uniref:CinA family protein n=1 Tax=Aquaspirillum sp. LM1 TaxID=1938604 RepID=UPI0009838C08|nr:CinA family protein [Aquaspirillum sp. LM1]AQR64309.1 damage-inducible protein CinA [Aquaspirillum sp. LM1]
MTPTARHLAAQLGDALRQRQQQVATAESCTGGLIAGTLTAIPGSSDWFGFGWVSYANDAKQQMLGVSANTLARHGAVSADTVGEMAAGARLHSHADWAIAVSGIAGPGGGSRDKPVGLVWFGLAGPHGVDTFSQVFAGGRDQVREQTVETALQHLLQALGQA